MSNVVPFWRVSVKTGDGDDDIRDWNHEIRGGPVVPAGVTCECLTQEMADQFVEFLNSVWAPRA